MELRPAPTRSPIANCPRPKHTRALCSLERQFLKPLLEATCAATRQYVCSKGARPEPTTQAAAATTHATKPETVGKLHHWGCREPETFRHVHARECKSLRLSANCIMGTARGLRRSAIFMRGNAESLKLSASCIIGRGARSLRRSAIFTRGKAQPEFCRQIASWHCTERGLAPPFS